MQGGKQLRRKYSRLLQSTYYHHNNSVNLRQNIQHKVYEVGRADNRMIIDVSIAILEAIQHLEMLLCKQQPRICLKCLMGIYKSTQELDIRRYTTKHNYFLLSSGVHLHILLAEVARVCRAVPLTFLNLK